MLEIKTSDPIDLFSEWYQSALDSGVKNPDAMALATVDSKSGHPKVRMVLYKGLNQKRLWFVTSYLSPKSKDLEALPHAALCFFWDHDPQRQIRIEGSVEKLPRTESEAYFSSRPRESQIGAWASEQSSVIPDRDYLEASYQKCEKSFEGQPVPCPETWGGWTLTPSRFEFWEGRSGRLHDRFQFTTHHGIWRMDRLAP